MLICSWFKSRVKKEEDINIDELIERFKKLKPKLENPHNKAYHGKLNELLQSKTSSRDAFINWITGLATGALFFTFANFPSKLYNITILKCAGISLFLTILSALAFKIFLEVRYSALELEVALLQNLWEGHDLKSKLEEMFNKDGEVDENAKKEFLRNYRDSLNYLDDKHIEKLKKPVNIKSKFLTLFYWSTLILFILGVSLIGIEFILFASISSR
ncbi:MAG: hypothetical protein PHC54_06710 [Candidatus Omnitrophica bacterium]|nr:hypothetical protein [Candidatus Omnitrophota bacterium]